MSLPSFGTWECYRGDGFTRVFVVKKGGAVQDITGWTLVFTAKKAWDDSPPVISKALSLTDPTAGEATLSLTASETDLSAGDYAFDVEMTPLGGEPRTIGGTFQVAEDVRR